MSHLKLFKRSIALIFLCISSKFAIASIVEGICGNTIFVIKVAERHESSESQYMLYYKINAKEKKLLYTSDTDHLILACVQDPAKHNYLLLEEICGGSGCSDEGTYALIDSNTKKILVKYTPMEHQTYSDNKLDVLDQLVEHEQKNHEQVAKIIEYELPYLPQSAGEYTMQIDLFAQQTSDHITIKTYGAAKQIIE